ncbi:MAG: hypothetical protein KIT08_08195 [Anaerolineales bacterium]|nr:MAG: hypothetical protein KIT08_08195 [Anaerolineales bacterium]
MPTRLWTVLCKGLEVHHETATVSLHNVFSAVSGDIGENRVAKLELFSMVTAFGGELGEQFTFNASFLDPSGKPYGPVGSDMNITIRRIPEIVSVDFADFHFMEYGVFGIEIKLDGITVHVVPFYVKPI